MSVTLPELRVEVHKLGHEFIAVARDSNGREICTNQFQHNPTGLTHLGPLWLLERGTIGPDVAQRLGSIPGRASKGQVALYGRRLYEYLFGNGKALRKFIQATPAYQQARLTLSIHADAASLWRLPWEYLHDGENFLCLEGQMRFSRIIEGLEAITLPALPLPLRLLIVMPSPDDEEPLDVERELSVIMAAINDPACGNHVQMDVLGDVTLPALADALKQKPYHALHYIGHGKYGSNQRGYLCFQDAAGQTDPVAAMQLKFLAESPISLRLVVLSACQSAQIGVLDAFDNVAAGLLQLGIPAILTIPTSLQDESAIAMSRALYAALVTGQSPVEGACQARQALAEVDESHPEGRRRFDWGVPALYNRAAPQPVFDPALAEVEPEPAGETLDESSQIAPGAFIGRQQELQTLRNALRERAPALYVWGAEGVGKSTLAAKLVEQPGTPLVDTLVIRCQDYACPAAVLDDIATWWRAKGRDTQRQAASLLLDARQNPEERARKALQRLSECPYLIVFDNVDAWFAQGEVTEQYVYDVSVAGDIADETMRAILYGFASANSPSTILFTGRRRWRSLATLPQKLEIQLLPLSPHHTLLLMNTLPRLSALSTENKQAISQVIGGQPLALELLDGWLARAGTIEEFLQDPSAREHIAESWQEYFLNALLERLDPGEYEALTMLAVFGQPFCAGILAQMSEILEQHTVPLLENWRTLFLIELVRTDAEGAWYNLHPAIRAHILGRISPDARNLLHRRIADYYGAPFIDEARRQVTSRSTAGWDPERISWLARSANGVLGMWIRQTQDETHARQSLKRALAWQYHLAGCGEAEAASQIIKAASPVLSRWGQIDYARALLQHTLSSLEGVERASGLDTLAGLHVEIGDFQEALTVYQEVLHMLREMGAQEQMSFILVRIASVQQRVGNYDQAVENYQAALNVLRQRNDEQGQALCLRQLISVFRQKGDYPQALAYSQSAKILYDSLGDLAGMAAVAYEQGLIQRELGQISAAMESFHESIETARSIGDALRVAANMEEVASVMLDGLQYEAALKALYEALRIYQQHGGQRNKMVVVLESLGKVYEQKGDSGRAMQKYLQARQLTSGQDAAQTVKI
ncbi:MAG: CHAT domain-containing protein [Anaerolineae bacterium]|nr:CHAT domain-containing protein [Anaerolineae bacterium]